MAVLLIASHLQPQYLSLCTFGYHRSVRIRGRNPIFIKAVSKACEILIPLSLDFIIIHNGLGFDAKRMAVHSAFINRISEM